jgi:hypothetical protein
VRLLELLTLELSSPDGFDAHHTPAFLRDRAAELGGVETLLGLLNAGSPDVAANASCALAALVDGRPRIAAAAVAGGALPGLVRLVERAAASDERAAACVEGTAGGCRALRSIAAAGEGFGAAVCAAGAPVAAVGALAAATNSPSVSRAGICGEACGLLAQVCRVPGGARAAVQAGAVNSVCRVLDGRPERPTLLAALEVLTVIAGAAKLRAGVGRRAAPPPSHAPTVAEALGGAALQAPYPGGSERQPSQGAAAGLLKETSAEGGLRPQQAGQRVPDATTASQPVPVFPDGMIGRILASLPPMTAAKAVHPVRRELESRMGLAPGSLLAEQAEIDRGIRRAKEAAADKSAPGGAAEHQTARRTLAAEAEGEAAVAAAADASLAQLACIALRRDGVGGCVVRSLQAAVTGTASARHDWRLLCAICAALEALLSPNGALGDLDSRRALVSQGVLGALALAVGSAPHGEVSNDFDDLPDRFTSNAGASANVVCRASRLISLLTPDG